VDWVKCEQSRKERRRTVATPTVQSVRKKDRLKQKRMRGMGGGGYRGEGGEVVGRVPPNASARFREVRFVGGRRLDEGTQY